MKHLTQKEKVKKLEEREIRYLNKNQLYVNKL